MQEQTSDRWALLNTSDNSLIQLIHAGTAITLSTLGTHNIKSISGNTITLFSEIPDALTTFSTSFSLQVETVGDSGTIYGCTDSSADNYDKFATVDDGSCEYSSGF